MIWAAAVILFIVIVILLIGFWIVHPRVQAFNYKPKLSCIYAYYEKNDIYRDNLVHFLSNGGILPHVEYYFVINGDSSVQISESPNIHVIYRENKGYDFGAWGVAITAYPELLTSDYVFFMNTSVRGPFTDENDWTRPFIRLFRSPDVRLVGTSINICTSDFSKFSFGPRPVYPHVQSMFFVLDNTGLNFLVGTNIFEVEDHMQFEDLIGEKEVGMSIALLHNGWNINCILGRYKNLDYRSLVSDINPTSRSGDAYYEGSYFGESIKPTDVIFYKNTRFL